MSPAPRFAQEATAGVISDTHGLLRPEAVALLKGSGIIFHAGDVGDARVIRGLQAIARVVAVRGNNDNGGWAKKLPLRERVEFGGVRFYVLHNLKELDIDPAAEGFQVVVSGHSHRPSIEMREGVLFINPGSAGPRRFNLPISLARVSLTLEGVGAKILQLPAQGGAEEVGK